MKKYPAPRAAWISVCGINGLAKDLAKQGIPECEIRKAWSRNYQRMKKREKMKAREVQVVTLTQIMRTGN